MADQLPDDVLVSVLRALGPVPAAAVCRRWYTLVHEARPPVLDIGALVVKRGERWLERRVRACHTLASALVLVVLVAASALPALFLHGSAVFLCTMAVHAVAHLPLVVAATALSVAAAAGSPSAAGAFVVSAVARFVTSLVLGFCGPTMRATVVTEALVLFLLEPATSLLVVLCGVFVVGPFPDVWGASAPSDTTRRLAAFLVRQTVTRRALLRGIAVPPTLGRALQCNTTCIQSRSRSRAGQFRSLEEWMAAWCAVKTLEHRVRSVLRSA